jgi:hypothetical protein
MLKLSHSLLRTGTATRHKSDKVVVVIGGGAAGYFSAIECASSLQKMEVKSKVTSSTVVNTVLRADLVVRFHCWSGLRPGSWQLRAIKSPDFRRRALQRHA